MASRKDFVAKKRKGSQPASNQKPAPAKKTPAKAKPTAKLSNNSKQPSQNRRSPLKLIIASLLVILGIGYLLVQLSNVDPKEIRETGISALIDQKINTDTQFSENETQASPNSKTLDTKSPITESTDKPKKQQTAKKTKQPPSKNTPTVPVTDKSSTAEQKEPYQFYEILAKNSVETENIEAYKSTPKTAKLKNKTLLQTGSFRNQKDAENMKVRLLLNNLPKVTVQKTTSDKGTWYRVRTGPFLTFNSLKNALNKLNKMKINPMQVPIR